MGLSWSFYLCILRFYLSTSSCIWYNSNLPSTCLQHSMRLFSIQFIYIGSERANDNKQPLCCKLLGSNSNHVHPHRWFSDIGKWLCIHNRPQVGEKLGDLIYPVEITPEARCDVGSQGYWSGFAGLEKWRAFGAAFLLVWGCFSEFQVPLAEQAWKMLEMRLLCHECLSIYHYLSLSIIIYHYLSLSIIIYRYLSLSIIIYRYLLLSIVIYRYLSLSIIIYHYLSIYLSIYLSFHPSIYPSIYLVKNTIVLISTISIVYMATMHSTICAMDQGLEPQTICRRKTIQRSCTRLGQLDKRTNVRQRWHNPSQQECWWNF